MGGHGKEERIWGSKRALEKERKSSKYDQDILQITFLLFLKNFFSRVVGFWEKNTNKIESQKTALDPHWK